MARLRAYAERICEAVAVAILIGGGILAIQIGSLADIVVAAGGP